MTIFIALILGIVQGLTEFLPISSSGHLVLLQNIFSIKSDVIFFDVVLHLATLFAVIICYRKSIVELIKHPFSKKMRLLCVGTIPTVVIALLFKDFFENSFGGSLLFLGFFATSILLFFASFVDKKTNYSIKKQNYNYSNNNNDKNNKDNRNYSNKNNNSYNYNSNDSGSNLISKNCSNNCSKISNNNSSNKNSNNCSNNNSNNSENFEEISYKKAILIGIFQGLAIFPGLSRSGSTTTCALMLSIKKDEALEFSFLLSIPIIIASLLYEIIFSPISFSQIGLVPLFVGFGASLVFGIISIRLTKKIVKNNYFCYFAIYLLLLSIFLFVNQFFLHLF